ncbi:MAG: PHP domain-containing protein [Eubacteriaceae bacterium]|nr:PHP domain-containing protein [Eubacteriaceae bacterium]
MSRKYPVDLHIHTTASDGKYTPEEVIRNSASRGIKVISITDHDTVDAYEDGKVYSLADEVGIKLVSGIEFSCFFGSRSVHILGYFIDTASEELKKAIDIQKNERVLRMEKMVRKLHEMGLEKVSFEEIMKTAGSSVGRPHLARHLIEKGYCKEFTEVFEKYIGEGKPAYVKRGSLSPCDMIGLIHSLGGISVVAHPKLIGDDSLLTNLVSCGIDGIEVICPSHQKSDEYRYSRFAEEHSLLRTGGSDFHGGNNSECIGTSGMSYKDFLKIIPDDLA